MSPATCCRGSRVRRVRGSCVINSLMADTIFAGENPLGRRLKMTSYDQEAPWYTVAGVVGDTRHTGAR